MVEVSEKNQCWKILARTSLIARIIFVYRWALKLYLWIGRRAAINNSVISANYEIFTDDLKTPLHLAARYDRANVAKCLLDYGANTNARDRFNRTPLPLAIGAAQEVFQVNKNQASPINVIHVLQVDKKVLSSGLFLLLMSCHNIVPQILNLEWTMVLHRLSWLQGMTSQVSRGSSSKRAPKSTVPIIKVRVAWLELSVI